MPGATLIEVEGVDEADTPPGTTIGGFDWGGDATMDVAFVELGVVGTSGFVVGEEGTVLVENLESEVLIASKSS